MRAIKRYTALFYWIIINVIN